jgi:hypothetical protein
VSEQQQQEPDGREAVWPPPRDDPPEEPVEPWARSTDRKLGQELVEWEGWEKWR